MNVRFARGAPLCPVGHLPLKWGDLLLAVCCQFPINTIGKNGGAPISPAWGEIRGGAYLFSGQNLSRGFGDVCVGIGVTVDAPAAVWRFYDQNPCAVCKAGVARRIGYNGGNVFDNADFLVTVQYADGRKDFDPHIIGVAIGVAQRIRRQFMNKCSGIIQK